MTFHIRRQTQISRRSVLKGTGALMGLPLLNAMLPTNGLAASNSGTAPLRTAYVFTPNGVIMPSWTPEKDGADYELSETLKPLEPFKSEVNVISGLAQDNGRAKGDGPGDHARSASSFLTGAHPVKTAGADIRVGISADQVAAEHLGKETRLPSLEIGIERGRTAGSCDSGYSCAYSSAISWKTEHTPMAKEIVPQLVFDRLFGTAEGTPEERARRARYRRSILDLVTDDASKLSKSLGQTDRRKLDEYFTSVREIETRIEQTQKSAELEKPDFEIPEGVPSDLTQHIRLMYDLMVMAFRTDSTRIATFMLANEGSNRRYEPVGVKEGHHQLSHHRDNKDMIADLRKIDHYLVEQFAYFLQKMNETKDGDGSLLDHSMIVYGSGLGDGNRHRHEQLPIVLAGRGSGTIQTGRHIRYEQETPLNNLFLSLLHRAGANVESFGDSNGVLKELDA
ncbi:DUF1552 domain-containing protein [bacterium]|nr:DUF1552 domain-containing protein [bacterium]